MNYISITELNETGIYNINFNPELITSIHTNFCKEDADNIIDNIREIISNISAQYIGTENRAHSVYKLKIRIEEEIEIFLHKMNYFDKNIAKRYTYPGINFK